MRKYLFLMLCFLSIIKVNAQLAPGAPTSLTGSQILLTNSIKLNWTAPAPTFDGYKIFFQAGTNPIKNLKIGKVLTDTLENLTFNQTYKVYLRTYKLGITPGDTLYSPKSDSLSILLVGLVAPSITVEAPQATPTSIIYVVHDTNPFETGTQVEIKETGTNTVRISDFNSPGSDDVRQITGLKPKTLYEFRVRAKYNSLFGPWSSPVVYGRTKVDFPPAATLSYDKNCPDLVHISWVFNTRPEDVNEVIIQKSTNNKDFVNIKSVTPNIKDYYDSDVLPGSTVYYRIVSINESLPPTGSAILAVRPKTYVNPQAVAGLISDQKAKYDTYVTLRWTNRPEDLECGTNKVDEIIVYIKKASEADYSRIERLPSFSSFFKITNLTPRTAYNFGIRTLSNKGLFSDMVTIKDTTFGPPLPAVNLAVISTVNALGTPNNGLNWKYEYNDHDYAKIERSTGTGPFVEIAKIKSSYNYFVDMNIEEGIMYSYRVVLGNFIFGDGLPSEVNGPRIFQYTKAPNAPVGIVAKLAGNKVGLTWIDDSIREENQILEKSSDNGSSYSTVATLARNITSYTDENVLSGKIYLYRIKAINSIGESGYSKTAEIKIPGTGFVNNNSIGITVFPNPTLNDIKIEYSKNLVGENISVKVFDKMNRLVQTQTFKGNISSVQDFSLSKLLPGLYNVVISSNGETVTKKVMKY